MREVSGYRVLCFTDLGKRQRVNKKEAGKEQSMRKEEHSKNMISMNLENEVFQRD